MTTTIRRKIGGTLGRWANNLPQDVDADLPGGQWCAECGISTNHTTAMHEAAAAEGRQEP